jgi:hypothetical protein
VKPFKSKAANRVESGFLGVLCLIAALTIPASVYAALGRIYHNTALNVLEQLFTNLPLAYCVVVALITVAFSSTCIRAWPLFTSMFAHVKEEEGGEAKDGEAIPLLSSNASR